MTDQEIKDLIEALKKERDEQAAKINSLTQEIESAKIDREIDVLCTKINSINSEFKHDKQSIEYLKGYLNASEEYKKKIDAINAELGKVNSISIPLSGIVPPQKPADEMIRTPLGMKKKSEVDQSFLARFNSEQKQEVK
jgi:predicted RNase H-like nuclease (RuvC/YqgF family)